MVHVYIDPRCRELRQQIETHLPSLTLENESTLDQARVFVICADSWSEQEETILKYRQRHFPGLIPVIVLSDEASREEAKELTRIGVADELLPQSVGWEELASRIYFWMLERHSATKLNTLFSVLNALPAGVFIVVEDEVVYANQLTSSLIRQPLSRIEGRPINEFVDPKFHEALAQTFAEAVEMDQNREIEVLQVGDEERWLSMRISPTYFLDKAGFFINLNDVTERKQSEARREYQAHLLDLVQDAIVASDIDLNVTYWNKAAEKLRQKPAKDVLGRPYKEIFTNATEHEIIDQSIQQVTATHQWEGVAPILLDDGQIIYVEGQVTPVLDQEGEITGFIAAHRDVTQRISMQRQLEERLRDFVGIHQVSQHFLQGTDVQTTIQEATDMIQNHFEAASTWISYYPESAESAWVAFTGQMTADFLQNYKDEFALNIRNYLFNQVMQQGGTVLLEDMRAHPLFRPFVTRYGDGDHCSMIALPLFWQGKRVGMFGLVLRNPLTRISEKAEVVKLFSNLITIGLHNTQLHQSLERNLRETRILYEIGSRLQQMRSPSELVEEFIAISEELLGYEYTALFLVEEGTDYLMPLAISGLSYGRATLERDLAYFRNRNLRVGQGVTGWVAANGKPLRIGDVRQDPRYRGIRDDIRSELCVPLIISGRTIGVLNVETPQEDAYTEADQRFLETVAAQFAIAVTNARLLDQLQVSAEQLRQLARRVSEAHENERKYISQELHDEIGQLVTAMRMSLRLVAKSLPEDAIDAWERLDAAQTISDHLIKEVREIASSLRPPAIQELGLLQALHEMVGRLSVQTGLDIRFEPCELPPLSDLIGITIYRCIQEGLTNAIRHADATRVDVSMSNLNKQVIVIIADNGRGMPASDRQGSPVDLRSIRDRLEPVMGTLLIESGWQQGTKLTIGLPL